MAEGVNVGMLMPLLQQLQRFNSEWLVAHAVSIIALLLVALAVLLIWLIWLHGVAGRRVRAQSRLGARGERRALQMLKRAGYEILGEQALASYPVLVDKRPMQIHLRADFLVKKAGRTYVAEAKSGGPSAQITTRATRRQLLEYQHAFAAHGLLLIDVAAESIAEVQFQSASVSKELRRSAGR